MAINPETQYPGKITPGTPEYPHGSARNITLPGDGTGTPWDSALVNDLFGFQQALLAAAGLSPSGNPDKVGASQYLEAVEKVAGTTGAAFFSITYATLADLGAGETIGGETVAPETGGAAIVLSELSSLFEVKDTGTADGIDVFSVPGGKFAHRVTSLAGDQFYSYKQRHLLGEALKKLRNKDAIKFTWYGDSNSVRYTNVVQSTFKFTIGDAYYQNAGDVVVNNRANSGYSAKNSFESHTTDHDGNISVINFGTNDATTQEGYPSLAGNIQQYLYWMERLIIRELNWGKAVVLVTPLPTRFDKAWETYSYGSPSDPFPTYKRIDAYEMGNALKYLASKYSIPVIDSVESMGSYKDEMFANAFQSISVGTQFGDPVHLNEPYTKAWGAKIAAAFIGDLVLNARPVADGDMITVTHGHDPVVINSPRDPDAVYQYYADGIEAAFAQGDDFVGNRALVLTVGERVTFSFYCPSDNMIIYPALMVFSPAEALIYLDHNDEQPLIKIDSAVIGTAPGPHNFTQLNAAGSTVNRPKGFAPLSTRDETNEKLWVPNRGWHTVTVLAVSGSVAVSGLSFFSLYSDQSNEYRADNPDPLDRSETGYVIDYLNGDLEDVPANGATYYAFNSATGFPAGATTGFVEHKDNSINGDGSIGILKFYQNGGGVGNVWTKYKLGGVWGAWAQS